jgi:hypothetical protein
MSAKFAQAFGAIAKDWRTPPLRGKIQSHIKLSAHFLPIGIHNLGELRQSQLVLPKPGGVCHVESIFLGSAEPTAARTDRSGSCHGLGSRSGPKVQNLCELSRPKP